MFRFLVEEPFGGKDQFKGREAPTEMIALISVCACVSEFPHRWRNEFFGEMKSVKLFLLCFIQF